MRFRRINRVSTLYLIYTILWVPYILVFYYLWSFLSPNGYPRGDQLPFNALYMVPNITLGLLLLLVTRISIPMSRVISRLSIITIFTTMTIWVLFNLNYGCTLVYWDILDYPCGSHVSFWLEIPMLFLPGLAVLSVYCLRYRVSEPAKRKPKMK